MKVGAALPEMTFVTTWRQSTEITVCLRCRSNDGGGGVRRFALRTGSRRSGAVCVQRPDGTVAFARVRDLVARGGTVVYRFHTDRVRAILPLTVASSLPCYLIGVTNVNDDSVGVYVYIAAPFNTDFFTALGGTVEALGAQYGYFAGSIPDGMLPFLRTDSRVSQLQSSDGNIVCANGTTPSRLRVR